MSYQNILTERVDKVAVITLNRPEKLNALSYELACDLDEELGKIETDDNVHAVVLTGAGPRAFTAGGDIHQMVKSTPEVMAARTEERREMNWHLATFTKPIIGAINGLAYGGGATMAMSCDLRVAVADATITFGLGKVGLVPEWGSSYLLWRQVGYSRVAILPGGGGHNQYMVVIRRPIIA